MEFVFEGLVSTVLPAQTGTSARGEWHSQNVVFEMQNNSPYTRKVSVKFFNKRDEVARLVVGAAYNVTFDIESREYNGRWYTDVRAWRIQPKQEQAPAAAPAPEMPPFMEEPQFTSTASTAEVDDLPF